MLWIKLGSFFMLTGVGLGAVGAHALKKRLTVELLQSFQTGVLYQILHALGLFVIAWLCTQTSDPKVNIAGYFMAIGIVFFSGSIYLLALTPAKWVWPFTPLGGLSFMIAWGLLLFSHYDKIN